MSDVQTIGILGGGQLGRMLSVAASRLGLRCHVFEPGAAPAGDDLAVHQADRHVRDHHQGQQFARVPPGEALRVDQEGHPP